MAKKHTYSWLDDGYSADQHEFKWKCPVCREDNCENDCIYECFLESNPNVMDIQVECRKCEREFRVEIDGETEWNGHNFEFRELSDPNKVSSKSAQAKN